MSVVRLREFGLFVFQVSKVTRQFFFQLKLLEIGQERDQLQASDHFDFWKCYYNKKIIIDKKNTLVQ